MIGAHFFISAPTLPLRAVRICSEGSAGTQMSLILRAQCGTCLRENRTMKLGIVTYQWGANWDLPTLIKNCAEAGYAGAELRTTHKHGVEVSLTKEQRAEVQKRFVDSGVELVGLGSTCEYHSSDPAVVKKNIELTKEFIVLSHDVGGSGVKVR